MAHELEKIGVHTVVIDRFYSLSDFFNLFEQVLDDSFVGVGISTTFFTPQEALDEFDRFASRRRRSSAYYDHGIIHKDEDIRKQWFVQLKKIMSQRSPRAKLFVGGAKASFFTNQKYKDLDEVDYVVMGAVDLVFPSVVMDLINQREPAHRQIGNKKVIDTMSHYLQPKACPKHVWLPHWGVQFQESLPIEIGRGCAFNCKFCNYDKKENTRKAIGDLRDEFIENYERFGTQFYHFVDDCFNDHPQKVETVCEMILSLPFKIEWITYARFDVAVKFPHTADLMVRAGGRGFHWGVESLTPEVARRAGKGTPSEKIKEFILDFAKKYKGLCYNTGSFISGLPGETEDSWAQQIEWLMTTENFDFLQMGPLGIAPYKHEFDGTVVDYADYSRNPQKYGFSEISEDRTYWRHETMDSIRALQLAEEATQKWAEKFKHRKGISTDIWIYPFLRSVGYSEAEVFNCYFSSDEGVRSELLEKGRVIYLKRKQDYLDHLQTLAKS